MKAFASLIGFAMIVGALVLGVAVVATVAAVFVLYRGGRAYLDFKSGQARQRAHARAELLARAELEHRWWIDGDPRGTYGRYTPAA